ncbi:MAG: hypothetical protein R3296_05435 [Oleiphilaceae bacterium]|nr:hypothetical protein [Oleiphilaceae bacterium]
MSDPTPPAFIDFEASSLDLVASYPIEVGVCLPEGHIDSWLIEPHILWREWSESAQNIHGIERQQLLDEGHDLAWVACHLNEILPDTVYCDAWTFDSFWLHRLYRAARVSPAFQLESVSAILTPAQVDRWAATRARVIRELSLDTHRAANDALILHETWKAVVSCPQEKAL